MCSVSAGYRETGLSQGETVKFEDLTVREGLHYKKFTDVPFTGTVTGRFQGKIKNGKKDGPWIEYHDNGQLWSKGTYKDGKRVGPYVRYYANGQLSTKGTFKDGKLVGPWVGYNKDGTVWEKFTGTYRNGELVK